jgi:hypothetical protein
VVVAVVVVEEEGEGWGREDCRCDGKEQREPAVAAAALSRDSPALMLSSPALSPVFGPPPRLTDLRLRISPNAGFDNPFVLSGEYGPGDARESVAYEPPAQR